MAGIVGYVVNPTGATLAEAIRAVPEVYTATTDTSDFWRREGKPYPNYAGRFTGKPAYFKHVTEAAKGIMKAQGE